MFWLGWYSSNCSKQSNLLLSLRVSTKFPSYFPKQNIACEQSLPKKNQNHFPETSVQFKLFSSYFTYVENLKHTHDKQHGFRQLRCVANLLPLVIRLWYESLEVHGNWGSMHLIYPRQLMKYDSPQLYWKNVLPRDYHFNYKLLFELRHKFRC